MITRHRNQKSLFLVIASNLLVSLMVLSLLLASCVPSVTKEEGASPEEEIVPELQAEGKTFVVTSIADSGPSTLRQALLDAESSDTITFDPAVFPPSKPTTLFLLADDQDSSLPNIDQGNITIDASNAGVILDGSDISGDHVNGLEVYSNGNIIQGLQIFNFSGSGIVVGGAYNEVGGDRGIGEGPFGQGNLVGNNGIGIDLCGGASFNTMVGNLVGTDVTGTDDLGNDYHGLLIEEECNHNTIGPSNIIAYNGGNGILISGQKALNNTISQNSIHDNGYGYGICLWNGGNIELSAPFISDFDLTNGTVTGTTGAYHNIEIFSDSSEGGEIFEGQTTAGGDGFFTFDKGISFTGPHLTATATDADGNTSEFSMPASGTGGFFTLQENNTLPKTQIQNKESGHLEDNRIGVNAGALWNNLCPEVFPEGILDASDILQQGFKRIRFAINNTECNNPNAPIEWNKPELSIDPSHDEFITSLADNGIAMTYVLSFWDKAYVAEGGEIPSPRFKTEDEIQRYLDFVRFIVRHFKDRIEYYEIWNEPDGKGATIQRIEVEDYINLVRRVVPVIREEYLQAKIVVGSTTSLSDQPRQEYLFTILESDIMPLVDVVAWHPMYGCSPECDWLRQYYYEYPYIVQDIKDAASAHGFTGEYVADEIHWCTPDQPEPPWPTYTEIKSAKYLMRGIVMHLGMDITVSQITLWGKPRLFRANQNLCTVMAGIEPANLLVEIQSEATNLRSYIFSLPNGDRLIALWTDGEVDDNYSGINTTMSMPGLSIQKAVGIDVLYGFEQELITSTEDGNLVIENLLIKDYPIILRLIP